jgi:aminomethyltransferase
VSLRRSPLHELHVELGAKFVEFGGWEMPLSYPAGTLQEHLRCRSDAVVFDVSHLGTVRLDGDGALEQLQRAFTNDLNRIGPGRAQYTQLCDVEGHVLDDCIIWWVAEGRFDVMPNASNTSNVSGAIGGEDVTSARTVLAIQGPSARRRLAEVAPQAAAVAHFGVERFEYRGESGVVAGTGYTGEDGVECALPNGVAADFLREVIGAGVTPAGLGARDTLRLEACLPLHGHELGRSITPLEAGLGWVVAFDKGDFTGRAALVAQRERGVERRLRAVLAEGRRPPHAGDRLIVGGEAVGVVTSGNYSPVLSRGIALGFLPPGDGPGTPVEIEGRSGRAAATVVRPPFHRLEVLPAGDGD